MAQKKARIGIIGYGYIGSYVYEQITTRPELGLEIAFVYNRTREKLADLPAQQFALKSMHDYFDKPDTPQREYASSSQVSVAAPN